MNRYMVLVYPRRSHEFNEVSGRVQRTKARRAFFNDVASATKFLSKQQGKRQIVDQSLRMTLVKHS